MGFWTSLAATTAGAAGQFMAGKAEQDQHVAQTRMHRINAVGFQREARATQEATRFTQVRAAQAGERRVSTIRAKAGASGVLVDEGAPLEAVAAQMADNALEVALIGQTGRAGVTKLLQGAANELSAARFARVAGRNARTGGYFSAASTLLGGVTDMYANDMFPTFGTSTPRTPAPSTFRGYMGAETSMSGGTPSRGFMPRTPSLDRLRKSGTRF